MELATAQEVLQVILIDDNTVDHFLINVLFRTLGFATKVTGFYNVDEALLFFANLKHGIPSPMLILLDINMPVKNGFDFLEAFASLPVAVQDACFIVMLSSSTYETDIQRVYNSGKVKWYAYKPLTQEQVMQLLPML